MGYLRDHAIVVVGYYEDWIDRAHEVASGTFPWVSPISPSAANGCRSFFIPPDGSKSGWNESALGDDRRTTFIKWLERQKYEDGSSPLRWVEVRVGDDDHSLCIEQSYVPAREADALDKQIEDWVESSKAADTPERTPSEQIRLEAAGTYNIARWHAIADRVAVLERDLIERSTECVSAGKRIATLEERHGRLGDWRCTCEWRHPADGTIDADWPAELAPYCAVHGEPNGFPKSRVAALEQEGDNLDRLRLRAVQSVEYIDDQKRKRKHGGSSRGRVGIPTSRAVEQRTEVERLRAALEHIAGTGYTGADARDLKRIARRALHEGGNDG